MAPRKKPKNQKDARRYGALVDSLARTIRIAFEAGETGSLWGLEGPLRASIRADLCLQGWKWRDADELSREVVAAAHSRVGARRPSWDEGQLEWTIEAGTLIERTRCIRCHKPLPEGHYKFCGSLCGDAHRHHIARILDSNEEKVLTMVTRSI